mmetsp:Transcript_59303/g.109612  ORF Transcript_59303/g.109612 Transcript_59303/m.109612 type:complete len:224 (+) Transcript_59303:222-893(+)
MGPVPPHILFCMLFVKPHMPHNHRGPDLLDFPFPFPPPPPPQLPPPPPPISMAIIGIIIISIPWLGVMPLGALQPMRPVPPHILFSALFVKPHRPQTHCPSVSPPLPIGDEKFLPPFADRTGPKSAIPSAAMAYGALQPMCPLPPHFVLVSLFLNPHQPQLQGAAGISSAPAALAALIALGILQPSGPFPPQYSFLALFVKPHIPHFHCSSAIVCTVPKCNSS